MDYCKAHIYSKYLSVLTLHLFSSWLMMRNLGLN